MSNSALKLLAGSGAPEADVVYAEDVFSTDMFHTASQNDNTGIVNGLDLGDLGVGTSTAFNGETDYLSHTGDLTGNSDGKTFTFSCWVILPPKQDEEQRVLYATDGNDNGILLNIDAANAVGVEAWNGGSRTLQATTSTKIATNVLTNIIISLDTANSSNRYIYFNDVAASVTWSTYNNQNIEFTRPNHYVGIWGNASTRHFYSNMAHFYLDYTYRDLSVASNRRIFIDANGGSTSASSLVALSPIIYFPMTTAYSVGENAGTGGDFTVNGSPSIENVGTEYVAGSGSGGMIWLKGRNFSSNNTIFDSNRGLNNGIYADGQSAQWDTTSFGFTAPTFNANGYTTGTANVYTASGGRVVGWSFRKREGFFDIVTYTGNGGTSQTISHNLGSAPGFMFVKGSTIFSDWRCYHSAMGATKYAPLNDTDAFGSGVGIWNNTAPTATQFTVGDNSSVNQNGVVYTAYLFADNVQDFGTDSDEAIIKCGSYTGTGSVTGVDLNIGFEPQWLLIKNATASSNWLIMDTERGVAYAQDSPTLVADQSTAENGVVGFPAVGNLSATDFKATAGLTASNANGATHIYVAIRRPHKPISEFSASQVYYEAYNPATYSGGTVASGFSPDMTWGLPVNIFSRARIDTRLPAKTSQISSDSYAGNFIASFNANAQDSGSYKEISFNSLSNAFLTQATGWAGYAYSSSFSYRHLAWKRTPGFFDVVVYTGDSTPPAAPLVVNHNLGVEPEMMWIKSLTSSFNWWAGHTFGASNYVRQYPALNGTQAGSAESYGSTGIESKPTSTSFTVKTDTMLGAGQNWVAYLFASAEGVSKIGSYTGTTNDVNVDCGFTNGARFVLVKRTDATGDWYLWNATEGIVSGNDPYVLLNVDSNEVTNTDYIDPLASGFTITSSAPAALNASGGTYLFYAIA